MQAGAVADAELIRASRLGDRDAFAHIIERYQRVVYAVAYSGGRDRALADDITQDTFVVAWRRVDHLRDGSRLAAWLCGIARNLARDARKRCRREVLGDAEVASTLTPFEELSEAESERIVAAALGQVPDVYREPLVLYYYEERSVDDVARSLGISAATTNKRLSRGRRYLAGFVGTIEAGLVRHGPRAGLAASVLAIIAVTAPASHVDASTVKGSTMNKLALAATVTAALGGIGAAVAITVSRGDAHANPNRPTDSPASSTSTAGHATAGSHDLGRDLNRMLLAANKLPHRPGRSGAIPGSVANDCRTVAKHLEELEADATHGPSDRPDHDTADDCAGHYQKMCEREGWSVERRNCTLAAGDLINAHLCAAGVGLAASNKQTIPPALTCSVIGPHIASLLQDGGFHTDITDLPQQIEAACDMANWPLELRGCLGGAASMQALQDCIQPHQINP